MIHDHLWDHGPFVVRHGEVTLHKERRPWSDTTAMTRAVFTQVRAAVKRKTLLLLWWIEVEEDGGCGCKSPARLPQGCNRARTMYGVLVDGCGCREDPTRGKDEMGWFVCTILWLIRYCCLMWETEAGFWYCLAGRYQKMWSGMGMQLKWVWRFWCRVQQDSKIICMVLWFISW